MNPELLIVCLNSVVIGIAYFVIYPRFCRANGNKIAVNDLIATGLVLLVAGSLFWGTGQSFNMIIIKANWFWFTLITYAAIEIPLMIWYFNKHDVWSSFDIPPDK